MTPAHLTLLQDLASPESIVSKLIVGGDILTNELCENISIAFSHPVHIYNEYGPTEATVGCMIYEYTKMNILLFQLEFLQQILICLF